MLYVWITLVLRILVTSSVWPLSLKSEIWGSSSWAGPSALIPVTRSISAGMFLRFPPVYGYFAKNKECYDVLYIILFQIMSVLLILLRKVL